MNSKKETLFSCYIQEDIKYIDIKTSVDEYPSNSLDRRKLVNDLKENFNISDNGTILRLQVSHGVMEQLQKYLIHFIHIHVTDTSEEIDIVVTELYRCFRNLTTNEHVQNYLSENTSVLQTTRDYIDKLNEEQLCLKIILQFFINLVSSNRLVAEKLYNQYLDLFASLFQKNKLTYECSALVYNISLLVPMDMKLIEIMFKACEDNVRNEFIEFFIENCVVSSEFWNMYNNLSTYYKLIVIETLRMKQIENKKFSIPNSGLNILVNCFLKSPDIFFKINSDCIEEVQEVSLLLEIISSFSSRDEYITHLQENKDILVTAAALLINFHQLGKQSNNIFTPIQKLSQDPNDKIVNPVFGLKANLIQLLGNMCWKNMSMQNLAREAEIIPVILDCCNIDANNPFIIQWCIFAIRNVCEKNPENQKLIAGLHKKGTVSSRVLEEFGITLHGDGDSQVKIVPLDNIQK